MLSLLSVIKVDDKIDALGNRLDDKIDGLGARFERHETDLKVVLDVVLNIQNKLEKVENNERKIEDHEHRLCAVEYFVKKYPE